MGTAFQSHKLQDSSSGTSRDSKMENDGYTKIPATVAEMELDLAGVKKQQRLSSPQAWSSTLWLFLFTLLNIVALIFNLTVLVAVQWPSGHYRNAALRATSSYTPIFDMIDLEPTIKRINGTLYPAGDRLSIARQFPNPDADAIWEEDIELIRPIPITRDQIIKMGKNPDTVAKLEDEIWGLGDDAYVAALDIFHNLHCLNTLRQAAYANYYNQRPAEADNYDSMLEIHINHCTDILFQHISCGNNLNLVTRHWTEDQEYPFPDFSVEKQCINFDKLVEWHKDPAVTINMTKYVEVMKKPNGVKEEPKAVWHADQWFLDQHD